MHNLPLYQKYGLKKKYFSSISSKGFEQLEGEKNIYDEKDSKVEMLKEEYFHQLDVTTQEALKKWSENGYVILEKFYSADQVETLNKEVKKLIDTKKANWRYGNKIMFAIHQSDLLLEAGTNERIISILNFLMGKEVELFQSINFITASQQRTHSDSIHMTTFPYGNLIAVWIALEDITAESGPLHYYPGSHKLPYVMNKDFDNVGSAWLLGDKTYKDYEDKIEEIAQQSQLQKETFLAKRGDLLIWHANLLHGGDPLLNKDKTRKSMVFHYYSKDAICFHEITQRPSLKKR